MSLKQNEYMKKWTALCVFVFALMSFVGGIHAHEATTVTPAPHGGHPIEVILHTIIPYIVGVIELVGVGIIVYGSIAALFLFARSHLDFNSTEVKLELAQALALSLEFKLAAEILKSVIVRTLQELILLAAIVALRVVMTLLIHWEIETSEGEGDSGTYRQTTSENTLSAKIRERREEGSNEQNINEQGFVYRRKKSGESVASGQGAKDSGDVRQMRPTEVKSVQEHHEVPFILEPRHVTREEDGLMITIERNIGRLIKKSSTRHRRRMNQKKHPKDKD